MSHAAVLAVAAALVLAGVAGCTPSDHDTAARPGGSTTAGAGLHGGNLSGAVPSGAGVGTTPAPSRIQPSGAGSSTTPVSAEGATAGAVKPCPIASPEQVGRALGARPAAYTTRTSALGNALCVFTMTKALTGAHRTTVTVTSSLDPTSGRTAFAALEKDVPGVERVSGVGDSAFYVNDTSTLQFLAGHTSVVVQVDYHLRSGTRYARSIRAGLVRLARVIAGQL